MAGTSGGLSASTTAEAPAPEVDKSEIDPNFAVGSHPELMAEPISVEEANSMKDELEHGQLGWVALDEEGNPSGAATKEMPTEGPAARVMIHSPPQSAEVVTPTGAPLTKNMNPSPNTTMEEAFLQRNPIPGSTQHLHSDNVDVAEDNPAPPS